MAERDYVLGTHDAELERLGLQHRLWRPRMLDAWRRAGSGAGQTVLDVGAGPGYAALDLAEIVGPTGRVLALERSRRFLGALAPHARPRAASRSSRRSRPTSSPAPSGRSRRTRRGAAGCCASSAIRAPSSGASAQR
jgi:SAM-dependent methyltransferase